MTWEADNLRILAGEMEELIETPGLRDSDRLNLQIAISLSTMLTLDLESMNADLKAYIGRLAYNLGSVDDLLAESGAAGDALASEGS